MQKLLTLLIVTTLFSACKKEYNDVNDCYKYLSSLNISDAKTIYQKNGPSNTKSRSSVTTWKLDLNGNEVKLQVKDENGKSHDIGIANYNNFGDRFLSVAINKMDLDDILNLEYNAFMSISGCAFVMLVDKETEKMYRWPQEFWVTTSGSQSGVSTAGISNENGDVYFTNKGCIYKMDPKNLSFTKMLSNQRFDSFEFTSDDYILYSDDSSDKKYKVKCPQGKIYVIPGIAFISDNQIYSIENDAVYIWKRSAANVLEKETVEKLDPMFMFENYKVFYNKVRNSILLLSNYQKEYEFKDGKLVALPEIFEGNHYAKLITSKAIYTNNNLNFTKLDLSDYETSKFSINEYDVQYITASSNHPNISFSGIRYEDAAYVLGEITTDNSINIINATPERQEIINLVPIN